MNAIGFKYKPSEKARSIGGGQEVCACLSSETHDAAVAFCYDGYNQRGHEEVSMTLRSAMTGTEGNDADPKVAYGINPQGGGMNPLDHELGETQAVCHMGGVMKVNAKPETIGFKYTQSEKSQKPFAENGESQALSSGCHDSAVAIGFKAGQSKDGGLGDEREVSPTLSHQPSALEPTVAQCGVKCLNPQDQQTGRVYDPSGAMTSLQAGGGVSGMRRESVLMADNLAAMRYIVRRLTPKEAERLMGLPDGYTIPAGLDANDPALVTEFQSIFDTFGAIMAEYEHAKPPKPKSAKQVADWLKKVSDPATCPDSPRYKGCGNGWATNQPRWILMRLLYFTEQENTQTTQTTKEKENT